MPTQPALHLPNLQTNQIGWSGIFNRAMTYLTNWLTGGPLPLFSSSLAGLPSASSYQWSLAFVTDSGTLYYSDGTSWLNVATGGGGGTGTGYQPLLFSDPSGPFAVALVRGGWTVSAYQNSGSDLEIYAIDNDVTTRYASGNPIDLVNDYFKIDMGSSVSIGGLGIDNSNNTGDTPLSGDIYTSPDDVTYTLVASWVSGDIDSSGSFAVAWTPAATRYVKLVPTNTANGGFGNWWSIDEIYLYDIGIPLAPAMYEAAQTFSGSDGHSVTFQSLIQKRIIGHQFGMRMGPDTSNWFGVRWTDDGHIQFEKSVAGVVNQLGPFVNVDNDTEPHTLTFSIGMAGTGGVAKSWLTAMLSNNDGDPWTLSIADGSLDFSSGTMKLYLLTDFPLERSRGPAVLVL